MDTNGTSKFCHRCKPDWIVNCGKDICYICNYTEVRGFDNDPKDVYSFPFDSDCCSTCESYLEYKYEREQITYKDNNLRSLHKIIENKQYVVCYKTTKVFVDGIVTKTFKTIFVPPPDPCFDRDFEL
jgi:hypothetical protein